MPMTDENEQDDSNRYFAEPQMTEISILKSVKSWVNAAPEINKLCTEVCVGVLW